MTERPSQFGGPAKGIDPAQTPAATSGQEVIKDVWSRSGPKYRRRAIILLAVDVLLFAGVGSFAYWLRSGERFAPSLEGYGDELAQTFWSTPFSERMPGGASLGSLLLEPISVQDVPIQPWVVGLLMAALISVPILVSLLYRFWTSLPFLAVVAFLAVMPWLAVTLFLSCLIASGQRFRTKFRFTSALMGLVPVVVYLVLAWRGTAEMLVGEIDPVDRIKFIAPWVLAAVSAALLFAIVLAIAKVVDYRPGAIAPLLALMLALPVLLFEVHVGRDELYYRLLAGLNRAHFTDIEASDDLDRAVMQAWLRHPPPRPSMQVVRAGVETRWMFQLASDIEPSRSALTQHQAEIVANGDRFLKYFPDSKYAVNALYIKGRALDMRVDAGEFRRTKWIRFYDDFPSPASRHTWSMLAALQPAGAFADVALLKLAQLDARDGDIDRALTKLNSILARFRDDERTTQPQNTGSQSSESTETKRRQDRGPAIPPERIHLAVRRLHDLLTQNRDPIYGYEPISGPRVSKETFRFGLLDLDPRSDRYRDNLMQLQQWYPHCQIVDNIALEIAKATANPEERLARLESCLKDYPDRDATPETLFRLGIAYLKESRFRRSRSLLERLLADYADSPWAKQAASYVPLRTALLPGQETRTATPASGNGL